MDDYIPHEFDNEDLNNDLNEIRDKIEEISEKYSIDYLCMFSFQTDNLVYTTKMSNINSHQSIQSFYDIINNVNSYLREKEWIQLFKNLPSFKVECLFDEKPEGYDSKSWIKKGKIYIVKSVDFNDNHLIISFSDLIEEDTNIPVDPDPPYGGFDAKYFRIIDYSNLN